VAGALLGSASETRWGGTVGVGFDYGFASNWTVGLEYDHLFLGSSTNNFVTPAGGAFGTDNIKQDADLFTARINYRFAGFGGPVVGRY
jgi:outer membrane immunogenic protein